MAIDTEFLKDSPYFRGLADDAIADVARRFFEKKAERGEIISFEEEPIDALYLVRFGAVKTYRTSADGKEQIFRIVRPGGSFNDAPVFTDGINLITAEAMGPVDLYGIKQADIEEVIAAYPVVARNTLTVVSERVQALVSLVEDFSFLHVTGRVAKMLLQTAQPEGDAPPRLTQQEMAAMIGTAREMVGRSLKNLEEEGVIRMERNRVVITDLASLKRQAGVED